ncbi:acyl carrier protein [Nonomuraea sp. KC401]|uniref:acyl carrier protein n=1 Tax=unclassified Nonomuraea TaxID=2593643 RepID=UPI0010FDEDE9|nr:MULTISPECIES: acyl carrier protein [unclassified Nonomuraea]NBE97998.1 acyl carrier protein [Nonomuraea sp. K271]TLF61826.1 acyl carrier protein [Nonomuraea sp. KC401]
MLAELLADHLDVPATDITDDTGPDNLASWTSLAHIELITAVESVYGVRFTSYEIQSIATVGSLRGALRDKGVTA